MSIDARLKRLEERASVRSDKCPGCGVTNACGVVICIEPDGRERPACVRCLCDREPPTGPTKAYHRELLEAI